jgi:hypothetical protein
LQKSVPRNVAESNSSEVRSNDDLSLSMILQSLNATLTCRGKSSIFTEVAARSGQMLNLLERIRLFSDVSPLVAGKGRSRRWSESIKVKANWAQPIRSIRSTNLHPKRKERLPYAFRDIREAGFGELFRSPYFKFCSKKVVIWSKGITSRRS